MTEFNALLKSTKTVMVPGLGLDSSGTRLRSGWVIEVPDDVVAQTIKNGLVHQPRVRVTIEDLSTPRPLPERKPVQIAVAQGSGMKQLEAIALCDDGTLWLFRDAPHPLDRGWMHMPQIPQPGPPPPRDPIAHIASLRALLEECVFVFESSIRKYESDAEEADAVHGPEKGAAMAKHYRMLANDLAITLNNIKKEIGDDR